MNREPCERCDECRRAMFLPKDDKLCINCHFNDGKVLCERCVTTWMHKHENHGEPGGIIMCAKCAQQPKRTY